MLEIAIMVEGQNGLTWPRWQNIVRAVEDLGFVGLYRSDHFTNANPPDKESLELWISLTWLAGNSKRIEFGPLVTPFSFRHPAFTARMAIAVDDLSNGRLTLGLGAGWQEREHRLFGFGLLDMKGRFARFEEGLECVSRLLKSDEPVTFDGKYFHLHEAQVLPRPVRRGGLPILIGGNGFKQTLSLAARYASEWNANFITTEQFRKANQHLDELLTASHRLPESVRRSMMTGCVFGKTPADLQKKLESRSRTADELRQRGNVVGNAEEVRIQLKGLSEAGVQRVMLQWLELDDLEGLEALAK
ncbi:MAG TPA: TIGR03560 family F420-dependent LLM class oxidoreductase, partial [Anaerolineales bacterium]|nr:TIGR03560 family F420-dependent LLM class oxidoreductase [Anaerolineales bacterium]